MKTHHQLFHRKFVPALVVAAVYAVAIAGAVTLTSGCSAKKQEPAAKPAPVKIAQVLGANVAQTWEYPAEIKPRFETTLSFRVGGKISQRLVNLGDSVTDASTIARLDKADLNLAATQANAAAAQAKFQAKLASDELLRHQDLYARDLIAKAELERREAASSSAAAQLAALLAAAEQASNSARYGDLLAGMPGVVTALMVEAGQVVSAGQPVAQIAQTQQVEAAFAVPETQIAKFSVGQAVVVRVIGSDVAIAGRIREIAGMADPVGRTYAVRVKLDTSGEAGNKNERALKLGMSALVTVQQGQTTAISSTTALVPLAAVVSEGQTSYVLVIEQGKTLKRIVKLQQVAQGDLISVSGVKPGETVVATGAQFITPGAAVAPTKLKGV